MKKIIKYILCILGGIDAILGIIDTIVKYKSDLRAFFIQIGKFDFYLIGQLVLIFGLIILVGLLLFLVLIKILKLSPPQKSLTDLIVPFLLPEEHWKDSEDRYNRSLKRYFVYKFGLAAIICGLLIVVAVKIFTFI